MSANNLYVLAAHLIERGINVKVESEDVLVLNRNTRYNFATGKIEPLQNGESMPAANWRIEPTLPIKEILDLLCGVSVEDHTTCGDDTEDAA